MFALTVPAFSYIVVPQEDRCDALISALRSQRVQHARAAVTLSKEAASQPSERPAWFLRYTAFHDGLKPACLVGSANTTRRFEALLHKLWSVAAASEEGTAPAAKGLDVLPQR